MIQSLVQSAFADVAAPRAKVDWSVYARSCSGDEKQIIRWIMQLHNGGKPFDLDPTYSTGRFWEGLIKPRYRFDLNPQVRGVAQANATCLPLANESIGSLMFDPPFVVAPRPAPGIIRDRFACYPNVAALWEMYRAAMQEAHRVLRTGGIMAFKCQDLVSGGQQHWSHAYVMSEAQRIGFYVKDLFVLVRDNVLWSPNMVNQIHARKNHSYFICLVAVKP